MKYFGLEKVAEVNIFISTIKKKVLLLIICSEETIIF